ncbi:hypothetical protein ABK040_009130 [Willaertia magna]
MSASTSKQAGNKSSPSMLEGLVKAVVNGNTIKLCHPQRSDVEKVLILANIQAPRMATNKENQKQDEEPCAFEAREFLRKKLIGKTVKFSVEYRNPESQKDYGTCFLNNENINESILAAGFGKLKAKPNNSEEYNKLKKAEDRAKELKLGVWGENKQARKINWEYKPEQLLKTLKSKPVNVIVEHVINGSTLKVLLPTTETVVLNLSGVVCPTVKKGKDGKEIALPFGKHGKNYTELRLLNRDVTVVFEGIDKFDSFNGSIIISADESSDKPVTYQEELLLTGYAEIATWSAAKTKYAHRLRAAEQKAKNEKKGLWVDYEPPKVTLTEEDKDVFTARVVEVLSGDTVKILKPDGEEEKISLSNIKAPKFNVFQRGNANKDNKEKKDEKTLPETSENFGFEARDLLRSKVAGKDVQVRVDYRKSFGKEEDKEKTADSRRFCTLSINNKSVAVDIVKEGFANVIKVKSDSEKTLFYDQLILAETEAKNRGKGVHGSIRKAPIYHFNDISRKTIGEQTKFMRLLKDRTSVKAVVEKVVSGSRFKLYLPNDSLLVMFAVTGVSVPAKGKQFAKEALNFALRHLALKECEIIVDNIDKLGAICGELIVDKRSYTVSLVEAGLAKVQPFAEKLRYHKELTEAEDKAKQGKKGFWGIEDPMSIFRSDKKRPAKQNAFVVPKDKTSKTIRAIEMSDATSFYYHTPEVAETLKKIDQLISSVDPQKLQALTEATKDALCLTQFSEDNSWYRGKIVNVDKHGNATILFVDFGNSEQKPVSSLKAIPANHELSQIAPAAQLARLAFVVPESGKLVKELLNFVKDALLQSEFVSTVEYIEGGVENVTLVEKSKEGKEDAESLNEQVIGLGYARVDKGLKRRFRNTVERLLGAEDYAKDNALGIWEDGDIFDDEESDEE